MLNKIKFDVLIIIAFSVGIFFIDALEKNYYKEHLLKCEKVDEQMKLERNIIEYYIKIYK